jgi:hypothetical protein
MTRAFACLSVVKHVLAALAAAAVLTSTNCAGPTGATPPAVTADYSSPMATARTRLLAIKANDVDAYMACCIAGSPATAASARSSAIQIIATHRVIMAALGRWGEAAFGPAADSPAADRFPQMDLIVSDAEIDRAVAAIDRGAVQLSDGDDARLNVEGVSQFKLGSWAELTIIDIVVPPFSHFKKVGQAWKVDFGSSNDRLDAAQADLRKAEQASVAVNRLVSQIERGQFKSVAAFRDAVHALRL